MGPAVGREESPPESTSAQPELVVATSNPGKLREFQELLRELPISLLSLSTFPGVVMPEEGSDYRENALRKANSVAEATGRPALADDSGLEVSALRGAPGPGSARYGGPGLDDSGRVERLLAALQGEADRSARFVCIAALALPSGASFTALGTCPGTILAAPRGSTGFGYDPIFQPHGQVVSMAELPAEQKNRISHRGRALAALAADLERQLLATAPQRDSG